MLVVDASVLAVALADDGPDGAVARTRLHGETLAAPEVVDLEVTSVLCRQNRAGLLDARRAQLAMGDLAALPMRRAPHMPLLGTEGQPHRLRRRIRRAGRGLGCHPAHRRRATRSRGRVPLHHRDAESVAVTSGALRSCRAPRVCWCPRHTCRGSAPVERTVLGAVLPVICPDLNRALVPRPALLTRR